MFLIDTNVVSELRRTSKADPNVLSFAKQIAIHQQRISVITLQELEIGVLQMERRDPKQGAQLREWFEQTVRTTYRGQVLEINEAIASACARLNVPNRRPYADAILAATALVQNLTLVTRNVRDFAGSGVRLLNPFDANPKEFIA